VIFLRFRHEAVGGELVGPETEISHRMPPLRMVLRWAELPEMVLRTDTGELIECITGG
jgi:hypothetical protein